MQLDLNPIYDYVQLMPEILAEIRTAWSVAKRGEIKEIVQEVRQRVYSTSTSLILRRDLSKPLKPLSSKHPIKVRPIRDSDVSRIMTERPQHPRSRRPLQVIRDGPLADRAGSGDLPLPQPQLKS